MVGSIFSGVDESASRHRAYVGHKPRSTRGDKSYDALMRWEWEGGTPAPVSERGKTARTEPGENTLTRPQPANGVSGRVESRPPRPHRREVRKAMAANPYRQLLSSALLLVTSLAAVLTAVTLATPLLFEPPPLGWIAFAVLSLIVFALGAAAAQAVPRLPVSPLAPAVDDDRAHRLLVVADPPEQESYWLERELLPKARELAAVEVKQVVVPAELPAELGALGV